jgi:hypothetical protein
MGQHLRAGMQGWIPCVGLADNHLFRWSFFKIICDLSAGAMPRSVIYGSGLSRHAGQLQSRNQVEHVMLSRMHDRICAVRVAGAEV